MNDYPTKNDHNDKIKSNKIEPFIKWAGGKTQLLSQLSPFFPDNFGAYHEPFAGSLAVFFFLRTIKGNFRAFLSDANEELINCYTVVKSDLDKLIPLLKRHEYEHNKKHYYDVRRIDPNNINKLERAARFIYLNKTCYNGLYRVNSKGQFNVPMGSYKSPHIFEKDRIESASLALTHAIIEFADFSILLDRTEKNDLVYLDPPYYGEGIGFTGYALNRLGRAYFGAEEHRRLAEIVKDLDSRGCFVIISNSDTDYIRNIYHDFNIHEVKARRAINCNGSERGHITELVITNK